MEKFKDTFHSQHDLKKNNYICDVCARGRGKEDSFLQQGLNNIFKCCHIIQWNIEISQQLRTSVYFVQNIVGL